MIRHSLQTEKLLRLFFFVILLYFTFNSSVQPQELEKKARDQVIKYYVNDIFFDVQEQIKQKIIHDVKNQEIGIKSEDLEKIANIVSYNITEDFADFVPDIATKVMMKYYTENEIDALNNIYSAKTDDDMTFAKKNYYFQRELNVIITTYLYNNVEKMIESELTIAE